jgi:hypothetical protein
MHSPAEVAEALVGLTGVDLIEGEARPVVDDRERTVLDDLQWLSLIHITEPTRH